MTSPRKRLSHTLYIDAPNDIKTIFTKAAQSITLIHQPHDNSHIPIETYHYDQNGKLVTHSHTEVQP